MYIQSPLTPRCGLRTAALTALVALLPAVAHAQRPEPVSIGAGAQRVESGYSITGTVRDTSGRLLGAVEVRAGEQFTLTDRDGRFTLANLTGDSVRIMVRRIGYKPAQTVMALQPNVRRVDIAIRLEPSIVELGTVVVEARRLSTRLMRVGFYEREKTGLGTYFGPDYLTKHGGSFGSLLSEVASVSVARRSNGLAIPMGPAGGLGGQCPLRVFLDGTFIPWAAQVGLDGVISKDEVLAVEVYPRAAEVPARVSGMGAAVAVVGEASAAGSVPIRGIGSVDCGALLIWSKPLEPTQRTRP
jgi:hypothetical protein